MLRKTYTAQTTDHLSIEFHCVHCDARRQVDATAEGSAMAKERLIDKDGEARMRALAKARQDSQKIAESAVALGKCPSCGKRNGGALRQFATKQVVRALVVGAFFCVVGLVHESGAVRLAVEVGVLFAGLSLVMTFMEWRKIAAAQRGLVFHEPEV